MSKSGKNFVFGAMIALVAGYIAGILTAPKSGKQTRKDIADATNRAVTEAEQRLHNAGGELEHLVARVRNEATNLTGRARKDFDSVALHAEKAIENVRAAAAAAQKGEKTDEDLQESFQEAQKSIEHLKKFLQK